MGGVRLKADAKSRDGHESPALKLRTVWEDTRRSRYGRRSFMVNASRSTALMIVFLAAILLASPVFAQDQEAKVRVAHLSPDAPNVDVYVNDEPVSKLTDLPYRNVSPYLSLPAGDQNLKIYKTGDTSKPIVEADVSLQGRESYTIGVVGLMKDRSLAVQVYEDENEPPAEGKAKLRVIHAAPDVSSVDIGPEGGTDLFTNLGFPNATRYEEVPRGTYTLVATAVGSDERRLVISDAALSGGTTYTVFAVGQAGKGTLEVILSADAGASGGKQRVLPADPMPDTGGPAAAPLLFVGLALVLLGVACRGIAVGAGRI